MDDASPIWIAHRAHQSVRQLSAALRQKTSLAVIMGDVPPLGRDGNAHFHTR